MCVRRVSDRRSICLRYTVDIDCDVIDVDLFVVAYERDLSVFR